MCRSAIPLTLVTCHANMSACLLMLLEVNRCETPSVECPLARRIIRGSTKRPISALVFVPMFREFPHNKSNKGREARAYFW